ncbi:MAG: RnfABCDGE type electron transport complex subunit G [Treponema sp.]|nr:RnfABCDGE type electron transport complex subunit G [Treponema sp.]
MRHIVKPALSLFFISALAAVSLGVIHNVTRDPIAERRWAIQERMLRDIFADANFNEIYTRAPGAAGRLVIERVFEGLNDDGQAVGYVLELTSAGYGGPINLLVGISSVENTIAGVRILRHGETPGFGAVIVRENFFRRFEGRGLIPLVRVNRSEAGDNEFQAITSSTITTDAVVAAVNKAIEWYNRSGR